MKPEIGPSKGACLCQRSRRIRGNWEPEMFFLVDKEETPTVYEVIIRVNSL